MTPVKFDKDGLPVPQKQEKVSFDNDGLPVPIKKKEVSEVVSKDGGKAGISEAPSGFAGLKPAKVQPVKVEIPKQLREEEVKIPKQVAGAKVTDEGQGYISNLVSSLDRGFYKNLIGNPVKGLGTLVEMGTSAMTGGKVKEGPVSDALMRFGNWFNNAIDEVAPQDPEFKNSLSDQFGQALGQVGSLVLTGGVGAGGRGAAIAEQVIPKTATTVAGKIAAKAAPTLRGVKELTKELATPASISAGLTVGQSEFERAKEAGATDEQAFEAFYKNAAVGSVLEKIPVMQFFKRFNNATSGGVVNYLKTKGVAGITGGLEEATTEVLQQIYANKTAQDIYNINQNIFEGLTESGGIGFGVGFLLNAMGAQAKILRQQGKEQEAQTLENQEQEFKARAEGAPPPAPPPPPAAPAVEDIPEVAPQVPAPVEEVKAEVVGEEAAPQVPATPVEETELSNLLKKYDEGDIVTFNDLVDEIEALENPAYQDAIDEYRADQEEDYKLGGRGDMDAAEERFLQQVKEKAVPQVPAAPIEFTQKEDAKIKDIATKANLNIGSYIKSVPTGKKNRFGNDINKYEATNPFTNEKVVFEKQGDATDYVVKEVSKATTKSGREEIFNSINKKVVGEEAAPQVPATPEKAPEVKAEVVGEEVAPITEIGADIKNNTESNILIPVGEIENLRQQKKTDLATGSAIELERKLTKEGLKEPLVISYYPKEGKALLTDGHTRLDVASDMGATNMPIRIVEIYTDAPANARNISLYVLS